jgi:hypothetical protein
MRKINHQNYDLAFKESFSIFEDKTLDFLGLNLPKITESSKLNLLTLRLIITFWISPFDLKDGSILHIEEETHLTEEDLMRFAHYDLWLYQRYKATIRTIILTPSSGSQGTKSLDTGTIGCPPVKSWYYEMANWYYYDYKKYNIILK